MEAMGETALAMTSIVIWRNAAGKTGAPSRKCESRCTAIGTPVYRGFGSPQPNTALIACTCCVGSRWR